MPQPTARLVRVVCLSVTVACAAGLSACAQVGDVKPWEKGLLARPEMSFDGDRLDALLTEHTYASKEAASGGNGVGGGGCGCN